MKSSILRLVLACGGVLMAGACSSGGSQYQQSSPVFTGPEHSEVTLDNAGAEPRRQLRFAAPTGTRGVWSVDRSQSQTASSGVQNMKIIDAQVRSKAEWEVERSDATGTTVRWRWSDPPSVVRIDGDLHTIADFRAAIQRNADMSWHSRARSTTGDEVVAAAANGDRFQGELGGGSLEPFLAAEAVGVGASWTFVRTGERGLERTTMRLVSMTATEAIIEFNGTSRTPAQGATMGAETSWSGRVRWVEGLPDWAELTLDARTAAQVQRTPDSPQMVDMAGRVRMVRSCGMK